MVSKKTGSVLRLGLRLMQIESSSEVDLMPFVEWFGLAYHICNDYKTLTSLTNNEEKGFCEN